MTTMSRISEIDMNDLHCARRKLRDADLSAPSFSCRDV
jgi:hypothetical protein